MIETLATYLRFPFVQYALVAGTLTALCASLLGVPLVLRRFSYIGDGLSHVAFGAMAFAAVFGLADRMTIVLPATVACAILLLCGGRRRKIKGDAAIAMLSAGSLAVGYLLLNLFAPSANLSGDVCGTLFGATAILTLTKGEVIATVVLSVAVVAMFVLCYNTLFAITFDETFAKATGMPTERYNVLLAVVIAVVIVLAMHLVGTLLVSALVIFPAMTAMRLCTSFKRVTICAALVSVACALAGMVAAILAETPVGATIVAANIIAFAAASVWSSVR
ncbi:MAG: metal ABC transporter permease [Treponemataceae bacterium]|nr:metal ABC transporter permease [Treponemataceae bacterium]